MNLIFEEKKIFWDFNNPTNISDRCNMFYELSACHTKLISIPYISAVHSQVNLWCFKIKMKNKAESVSKHCFNQAQVGFS